jgi:hypothetical protein
MKYHGPRSRWFPVLALSLVAGGLTATAANPTDAGLPLDIDIRSTVDPKWEGFRKLETVAHGKLYLLAAVNEVPSAEKLTKPVNQGALAAQLRREMSTHGFREITGEEIPEVVLTVTYGRGFLRNPHLEDAMVEDLSNGVPVATITSPKQAMRQREAGYEAKVQKAQFEKLFVAVTAWQYPASRTEKPNQIWRTVMVVDNPDGRDLNLAVPAMLAAGVGYFDRDIKDGEVTVNSTAPSGRVKLGPLDVIGVVPSGK